MALRFVAAAGLAAFAAAQAPNTPLSLLVGTTETAINVTWAAGGGGVTSQYRVAIEPTGPVDPGGIFWQDDFVGSSLDSARWSFDSGRCLYSWYPCWSTFPSLSIANSNATITTPGYSYLMATSGVADYGKNGIGMLMRQTVDPQIATSDPSFETRVSFDYAYTGYTWTNSYGGMVAYDLQGGRPRWLMTWWAYCYQMNYQWNNLQVRYAYRYSWQSYTNIGWWTSTTYSASAESWPVDLLMMRSSASRTWTFFHKTWNAINYQPSLGSNVFYDSYWSGYTVDPTQIRVGLWAQQEASFTARVLFDRFIMANSSSMAARAAFNGYWVLRNQTLRARGICAISRSVERIVPGNQLSYLARDLIGNEGYRVRVRAEGPGGVSSWTTFSPSVVPTVGLPVAGPILYLDSRTLTATSRLTEWNDQSGNNNHFVQIPGYTGPAVTAKTSTEPFPAVVYTAGQVLGLTTNSPAFDITTNDMSVFIVYKPETVTVSAGLFGKGHYWYSRYGGWGIHSQERSPFTGAIWTMGMKVMGLYTYSNAKGCYAYFGPGHGIQWTTASNSHPHAGRLTLLSFVYGRTTGTTTDLQGYAGGSQTGWATGYYDNCQAMNTNTFDWQSTGNMPAAISDYVALGSSSWYNSIYDYYRGSVYAVAVYRSKLNTAQRQAVEGYLNSRFSMACSVLTGPNTLSSLTTGTSPTPCPSSPVAGNRCTMRCDIGNGFQQVGGMSDQTCSAGRWSGRTIVCAQRCNRISSPAGFSTCTRYFVNDNFTRPAGSVPGLTWYDTTPQVAETTMQQYWVQDQVGGFLYARNPEWEDDCSTLDPSGLVINNPVWLSSIKMTDSVVSEVEVWLEKASSRGGVIARYMGDGNYYRFHVSANSTRTTTMRLEKVLSGVVTPIGTVIVPNMITMAGAMHRLRLNATANYLTVWINDTLVMDAIDADLPMGPGGIYSESGPIRFSNFRIYGPCDESGTSCRNLNVDQYCTYTCASGFRLEGTGRQGCDGNGNIIGSASACKPIPPAVSNYTFTVYDDALQNAVIGTVLATPASTSQTITYEVQPAGNTETLRDRNRNPIGVETGVFSVNLCSGDVRVAKGGVMDYYLGSQSFRIFIRAYVNGDVTAYSEFAVNINVLPGPKPPVFDRPNGTTTRYPRYIAENSPVGARVPFPVTAYKPDGKPMLYRFIFGNQDGIWAINATTGQITVARAVLNYEATAAYNLMVQAYDANRTDLTDQVFVDIFLVDVNDPPVMPAVQRFNIIEDAAVVTVNNSLNWVVAASDEDVGDTLTWSLRPAPGSQYFNLSAISGRMTIVANLAAMYADHQLYEAYYVDSFQVRADFTFTAVVTDSRGAQATSALRVYIVANTSQDGNVPEISSVEFSTPGYPGLATEGELSDPLATGQFTLRGKNFERAISGANHLIWCNLTTQRGDATGNRTYVLPSCLVELGGQANTTSDKVRCSYPPGWGRDLAVICRWGSQRRLVQTSQPLIVFYNDPVLTTALGDTNFNVVETQLLTGGNQRIIVTGRFFGPADAPLVVRYGTAFEYQGQPIAATRTHNTFVFLTQEGAGSNLPVRVTVGLQNSNTPPTAMLTYARPRIDMVQAPNGSSYTPTTMSTMGGQIFLLTGINLGPIAVTPVVRYSVSTTAMVDNALTPVTYSYAPTNCRKQSAATAHTTIECTSVPGVGQGLQFEVTISGQRSDVTAGPATSLSYALPVITSISGPGTRLADTTGGQQVVLTGNNLGPITFGDGTPGSRTTVPISITYGRDGREYVARSCAVTAAPTTITCVTAPGTGKDHYWLPIVAGSSTGVLNASTSYAPPSIFNFRRPGYPDTDADAVKRYNTPGAERVTITGKNFGPFATVPAKFSANYRVRLRNTRTDFNMTLGNVDGELVFTPGNCIMTIEHTEIQCDTDRGAGSSLSWVFLVDGQSSSLPVTGYDRPVIDSVRWLSDAAQMVTNARTDGGQWVVLGGRNFGPRGCNATQPAGCFGFVQSITYGRTGSEYRALAFNLPTPYADDRIAVQLAPGFGESLRFRVQVADQWSDLSAESFSYAGPLITSVSPSSVITYPTLAAPVVVTVTGTNFGVMDSSADVGLLFGNPGDRTLRPLISTFSRTPSWDNPASRNHVAGNPHTLTFLLPPGTLPDRAVRVVTFVRGAPNGYTVQSSPLNLGDTGYLSYRPPVIDAVVVQVAPDVPDVRSARALYFSWVPIRDPLYQVTMYGRFFGPWGGETADTVARTVQSTGSSNSSGGSFADDTFNFRLLSTINTATALNYWADGKVVLVTALNAATIRLSFTGVAFNTSVISSFSNSYNYIDVSPFVNALRGGDAFYPTAGGNIIAFNASNLKSTVASLSITVGSRACDLLDRNDAVVAPTSVRAAIIDNPLYYDPPTPSVDANTVWMLRCRMPAGEGTGQSIVVMRDTTISNTDETVNYYPPMVTSIAIWNTTTNAWDSTPYAVNSLELTLARVPTTPTRLRMYGTNFGLCPRVVFGVGVIVQLGAAGLCGSTVTGVLPANHTFLEVMTPAGEGTGLWTNPLGWTINLDVAGQSLTNATDANLLVTQTVRLWYLPPSIRAVTATARTAGGDLITIDGAQFGTGTPTVWMQRTVGMDAPGSFPCNNVVRVSSSQLTCVMSEGSGYGFDVYVRVGDQTATMASAFSYLRPVVTSVSVAGGANMSIAPATGLAASVNAPLRGDSAGGYVVTLVGDNFGVWNYTQHCAFVAWRGRDARDGAPLCGDGISFAGEGELPGYAILNWTHTMVSFRMPPGIGARDLIVSTRGQLPAAPPIFHYATPWLNASTITPRTGPTDGGTPLLVRGSGFGFPAVVVNRNSPPVFPIAHPPSWEEYTTTLQLPTAYLRIDFHRACMTPDMKDKSGSDNSGVSRCAQSVLLRNHNVIQFYTASGIGVNRSVSVTVLDREPSYTQPGVMVDVNYTSNVVMFHYDPPLVMISSPNPVFMSGMPPYRIVFSGINFGRRADEASWTDDEKAVAVVIASRTCANTQRRDGAMAELECLMGEYPVGRHNVSYMAAGQWGFTNASQYGHAFAVCSRGYFGLPGEMCLPCPLGASCAGYRDTVLGAAEGFHAYPVALPTFFNLNGSMYSQCPPDVQDQFPGRDVCIVACEPPEACVGENKCADQYRSVSPYFRCASCNIGFYRRNGECVKCPDSPYAVVIGFVALVVTAGIAAYVLNKKKINIAFISIGIDYFQVLAIFAASRVAWPQAVKELFHVLSAFNLNLEIVAPECLVPDVSFQQKWAFVVLLPVSLGSLFLVVHMGMLLYKVCIKGRRKNLGNHAGTLIAGFLALFYILYLYLTRTILEIFNCAPTDPPDGYEYLSAVFERCGVPGGTQQRLIVPAIICLIGYTFGYPATLGALFYYRRAIIMEDQLLRAKGVGDDHLTNPHAYPTRKSFSRAYYQFKPDTYFWILAIILRKFFVAFTSLMFRRSGAFQMAACLLIMFLAYAAQVRWSPYMSPQDFEGVLKSHIESSYTSPIHARLRVTLANIESRGKKRAYRNLMTKNGTVDYSAVLGILTSWLFNYNTVESLLLFSAIIVNLMGIMYQAGTVSSNAYRNGRDGITSVIILTVSVTITYFVVVVATEITILCTEASRRRALEMQRTAKGAAAKTATGGKKVAGTGAAAGGGGGAGDKPDDDFNAGNVENQMNPMFLGTGGSGVAASASTANDAIMAQREPPSMDLWRVFQSSYSDLTAQVEGLSTQLQAAKLEVQRMQMAGGIADDESASAPLRTGSRGRKAEFRPTLSMDGEGGGVGVGAGAKTPVAGANPLMSGSSRTLAAGGGSGGGASRANPLVAARATATGRSGSATPGGRTAVALSDLRKQTRSTRGRGAAAASPTPADDE